MVDSFDPLKFQAAFARMSAHRDRMRFEGRFEVVEDLAIILEVVYASFLQFQALNIQLTQILERITTMAGELAALQAQVASNTTVIESAIQLIQGIKAALDDAIAKNNAGDPAALAELSATLGTEDAKLAASIAANTPAAPPPIPVPPAAPATAPGPAPSGSGTTP